MKTFGIIESDLIKGYHFRIDTIDKDDYRSALIFVSTLLKKYVIEFNGKIIHSSKTFTSVINRLNKLDKNFPLENESTYD